MPSDQGGPPSLWHVPGRLQWCSLPPRPNKLSVGSRPSPTAKLTSGSGPLNASLSLSHQLWFTQVRILGLMNPPQSPTFLTFQLHNRNVALCYSGLCKL